MKRGGFLKRKTALKAKKGFKQATSRLKAKKPTTGQNKRTRGKLTPIKTLRNKCDALLTPIIKKRHPKCLLCGNETQVAHHHIKKSTSSALRYYLPNLIPLCHKCHQRLHGDEILWAGRVIALKGLDWLADLEQQKNLLVKTNREWYQSHYERLLKEIEK